MSTKKAVNLEKSLADLEELVDELEGVKEGMQPGEFKSKAYD